MAVDLHQQWSRGLAQLRCTATPKRLRASRDGRVIADTTDALLVWEPSRVVPEYAVPADALSAPLVDLPRREAPDGLPPVLGPPHFELHTCPGTPVALEEDGVLVEVGFRPDDPDLGGRVVLDFTRFSWVEEDQPVMGHAHDPWKRIDVLASDRHVVVELGGTVLAESHRPLALFETPMIPRWYLPPEDVRMDLLTPSDDTHRLRLQGGGQLPQQRPRGRQGHRVVLPRAARRRAAGAGPRGVLVRARRRDRERRARRRRHA